MDTFKNHPSLMCFVAAIISCVLMVSAQSLECYSCNSLGLGTSHSNDACVTLDKTQIGTEPCQAGPGEVARCMVFKGTVTVDPPLMEPKTASGTYRSCRTFKENAVPKNGCYAATDIPNNALSTVFKMTNVLGLDQVVQGRSCYCSGNRCNTTSGVATLAVSYINMVVFVAFGLIFISVV